MATSEMTAVEMATSETTNQRRLSTVDCRDLVRSLQLYLATADVEMATSDMPTAMPDTSAYMTAYR